MKLALLIILLSAAPAVAQEKGIIWMDTTDGISTASQNSKATSDSADKGKGVVWEETGDISTVVAPGKR